MEVPTPDRGEDRPTHSVGEDVLSDHISSIGDNIPTLCRCAIIDGCQGQCYLVECHIMGDMFTLLL